MYFATTFVLLLALTSVYSKDEGETLFNERRRSPKVYLALGDALPAGTSDEIPGAGISVPFSEVNYPNILNQLLGKRRFDQVINLSCPNENTATMLDGNDGNELYPDGSLCYGTVAPLAPTVNLNGNTSSQLNAAKYILANYDVGLITITLGGNDGILCLEKGLSGADFLACALSQLDGVKLNLKTLLDELVILDPKIPILISNYYIPFLAFELPGTPPFLKGNAQVYIQANFVINEVIADVVESVEGKSVKVVDLESAFDSRDESGKPLPKNVVTICRLTNTCAKEGKNKWVYHTPNADIFPNKEGDTKVAQTFLKMLKRG